MLLLLMLMLRLLLRLMLMRMLRETLMVLRRRLRRFGVRGLVVVRLGRGLVLLANLRALRRSRALLRLLMTLGILLLPLPVLLLMPRGGGPARGGVSGVADARAARHPHDGLGAPAAARALAGDDERVVVPRPAAEGAGRGGGVEVAGHVGGRARGDAARGGHRAPEEGGSEGGHPARRGRGGRGRRRGEAHASPGDAWAFPAS